MHPLPKAALHTFKNTATCRLALKFDCLREPTVAHGSVELEEHMQMLHSLLSTDAMQLAKDILPFTQETVKPQRNFKPQGMAKKLERLLAQSRLLYKCRNIYLRSKAVSSARP